MIQITSDYSSVGIGSSEIVIETFTFISRTLCLEFPSINNDDIN